MNKKTQSLYRTATLFGVTAVLMIVSHAHYAAIGFAAATVIALLGAIREHQR